MTPEEINDYINGARLLVAESQLKEQRYREEKAQWEAEEARLLAEWVRENFKASRPKVAAS